MSGKAPIREIVLRLGGQSAVARLVGVSQGTVWGWVNSGRIPAWRIPEIIEAAANLPEPITLSPADFFPKHKPTTSEAAA